MTWWQILPLVPLYVVAGGCILRLASGIWQRLDEYAVDEDDVRSYPLALYAAFLLWPLVLAVLATILVWYGATVLWKATANSAALRGSRHKVLRWVWAVDRRPGSSRDVRDEVRITPGPPPPRGFTGDYETDVRRAAGLED